MHRRPATRTTDEYLFDGTRWGKNSATAQQCVGAIVPFCRSAFKPKPSLGGILLHTITLPIASTKLVFGLRVSLLGRNCKPFHGFYRIWVASLAFKIALPEILLGQRVSRGCRSSPQFEYLNQRILCQIRGFA